jgi:cobalamin biosynthetic protein CobC
VQKKGKGAMQYTLEQGNTHASKGADFAALSALAYHGGNLTAVAAATGRPECEWLDVSTGINPTAYPHQGVPSALWQRLPIPSDECAVVAAAAAAWQVPTSHGMLVPGSQAGIQWLPAALRRAGVPEKAQVVILAPTYGEHAQVWRYYGADVRHVATWADFAASAADVKICVNPNNPTGRVISPKCVQKVAQAQAVADGWLVVDEAFMDCLPPEQSVLPDLHGHANLVVLRSFGKFYGLAGLRLGFVWAHPVLLRHLAGFTGPWAVAGPALYIGKRALEDVAWQASMRQQLQQETQALDHVLIGHGLRVIGGTPLFRYVQVGGESSGKAAGHALYGALCAHGVLVRPFRDAPNHIRIGLPGVMQLNRLDAALAACLIEKEPR